MPDYEPTPGVREQIKAPNLKTFLWQQSTTDELSIKEGRISYDPGQKPTAFTVGKSCYACRIEQKGQLAVYDQRGKEVYRLDRPEPNPNGMGLRISFGRDSTRNQVAVKDPFTSRDGRVSIDYFPDGRFFIKNTGINPIDVWDLGANHSATAFLEQLIRFEAIQTRSPAIKEDKKERIRSVEKKGTPRFKVIKRVVEGRSGEDAVRHLSGENLGRNSDNVLLLAGVFDGFSGFYGAARSLAEDILPEFWHAFKQERSLAGRLLFDEKIKRAMQRTDRVLTAKHQAEKFGSCVEMMLTTDKALYLVRLGDGHTYARYEDGSIRQLHSTRHERGNMILGVPAVTHGIGWAMGKRQQESDISFDNTPSVERYPWKELAEKGVKEILLTSDWPDQMEPATEDIIIQAAFEQKLGQGFLTVLEGYRQTIRDSGVKPDDAGSVLIELIWGP